MKSPDLECDFTADPHTSRAEGWASLLDRSDVLIIDCEAASAGQTTALVTIGGFSFLVEQLTELPLVSIPLLAIARVLP